jgi:hypothetical protein
MGSNCEYGLTSDNLSYYMENLNRLTRFIYIWPVPFHIKTFGGKDHVILHLDIVAETITKTPRPTTKVLKANEPLPPNAVIKQTHSDAGCHVHLPTNLHRNWEYMNEFQPIPESLWMAQTYVPTLRSLGKWRVFIIGGQPIHIVHTKYKADKLAWSWESVERYYTLNELT